MVQKNSLNKIIIICGATASGKTDLAINLAKSLDTEIISADSMNVYKELNIGTAKPSSEELKLVKHHMIDVVSPFSTFSVGDYKEMARPILNDILKKGKIPVICGGTGFYINSLLYELSYGALSDASVREKYFKLAEEKGKEYVYDYLLSIDKPSAEKIHFNDIKRVIRAIEIYECGLKKSELNDSLTPLFDYDAYCIDFPRQELYQRIDYRVDKMVELGLVDEVKTLVEQGLSDKNQSMQGIGYKEIYLYLKGEISLQESIDLIKLNTRHYAKRQITFFKKLENLYHLEPNDAEYNTKIILGRL